MTTKESTPITRSEQERLRLGRKLGNLAIDLLSINPKNELIPALGTQIENDKGQVVEIVIQKWPGPKIYLRSVVRIKPDNEMFDKENKESNVVINANTGEAFDINNQLIERKALTTHIDFLQRAKKVLQP